MTLSLTHSFGFIFYNYNIINVNTEFTFRYYCMSFNLRTATVYDLFHLDDSITVLLVGKNSTVKCYKSYSKMSAILPLFWKDGWQTPSTKWTISKYLLFYNLMGSIRMCRKWKTTWKYSESKLQKVWRHVWKKNPIMKWMKIRSLRELWH